MVNTLADLASIAPDALRFGKGIGCALFNGLALVTIIKGCFKGIGCALFNDQASGYDRARAVGHDALRGLTLTGIGSGVRAVAKGIGKAVSKAARGTGKAARAPNNAVIGRLDDLKPSNLRQGEHTLLDKLSGNLGSPKANWKRNSSVLREEMRRGIPIRDASARLRDSYVLPDGRTIRQTFLGMERNTLRNRGWTFDGEFWNPPTK